MPTLAENIDRLGKLRDRIHRLNADEKALAETVRTALAKRKGKSAEGAAYSADLVAANKTTVDVADLKRIAGRKFLQVIRADLKAARKILGEAAVKAIARLKRGTQLKVYRKKAPATAPRRAARSAAG